MAARRALGDELRRLRGDRRGAEVASELGWSESKLSRIETARTGISEADLERLLTVLDVPTPERSRLKDLAGRGRARVWWAPYRSSVADRYDEYVALEAEAATICEWEPQLVPGLLQTDEYARAIIEAGVDVRSAEILDHRMALRMARQSILSRDPAPQLCVVIDEAVLRRQVGGPQVLRRQLQRLFDAGERPGIDVLVMPFAAGSHAALTEAFIILGFAGRAPVVHSEDLMGGQLRTKATEVDRYREAFADLRRRALSPADSRYLIARTGESLA